MKSPLIRLCGIALIVGIFTAVGAAFSRAETEPSPVDTTETAQTTLPFAAPYAYVGAWQGRVAVFSAADSAPQTVYDTSLASLPLSEQEALQNRISVYDEVALRQLIEEYTG